MRPLEGKGGRQMAQAASHSLTWSWPGPQEASAPAWSSKSSQPGETELEADTPAP